MRQVRPQRSVSSPSADRTLRHRRQAIRLVGRDHGGLPTKAGKQPSTIFAARGARICQRLSRSWDTVSDRCFQMDKLEKVFDLVERLSDVRSNSLTFGKFGDVVLQLDRKIGAYKLKRIGLRLERRLCSHARSVVDH